MGAVNQDLVILCKFYYDDVLGKIAEQHVSI